MSMKVIGLLGGMSWESTLDYYRIVNEVVAARLGGLHSARVVLHSVDFETIERCQSSGDWDQAADILGQAAAGLQAAGADFLVICTNTMHKVVDRIQTHVRIPILHIGDVTADALTAAGVGTVALLGTRYTMTQPFLKARLAAAGLDILVPDEAGVQAVDRIIFQELCRGQVREQSRAEIVAVIDALIARGAQGVVLGCTELPLLIKAQDCPVPVFDTTALHATAAAELALL
jgi:aspartate racemase